VTDVKRRRAFVRTGTVAITFVVLNVASLHFRSSGGLLEVLGVSQCADCIRAWGFPLEVWRSGGFIEYRMLSTGALLVDVAVGLILSVAVGFAWARLEK
jgi:hypothetical protein